MTSARKSAFNFNCPAVVPRIKPAGTYPDVVPAVIIVVLKRKIWTLAKSLENVCVVSFSIFSDGDFTFDLHLHLCQIHMAFIVGPKKDRDFGRLLEMCSDR